MYIHYYNGRFVDKQRWIVYEVDTRASSML